MDLNGDGNLDILSGSYSRHDREMAGLFQVLWGTAERTFAKPVPLTGTDGELLIITPSPGTADAIVDKICTRPFAVDLDGDGKLDIVSGNFGGTFVLFQGEGKGRFAPTSRLLESDGEPLRVDNHSDPFFVDWDGDGDFDLISGSAPGGAYLFENQGSKTEPKFKQRVTLLAPTLHAYEEGRLGDAHLVEPQSSTRVWVDDVNGDGRLDLLVGDSVSLSFPIEGVDDATTKELLAAWTAKQKKIYSDRRLQGEMTEEQSEAFGAAVTAVYEERKAIVRDDNTGFVWVLYRK